MSHGSTFTVTETMTVTVPDTVTKTKTETVTVAETETVTETYKESCLASIVLKFYKLGVYATIAAILLSRATRACRGGPRAT